MTKKLPKGWAWAKLGEVATHERCKATRFDGEKKYFATGDMGIQTASGFSLVSWDKRPGRADVIPRVNDVGFALMKNTKKVFLVDDDYANCVFSTGFGFIRPTEKILPKFLFYCMISDAFHKQKNDQIPDSIMSAIRIQSAMSIRIPLPPIAEQQQIVARLDRQMAAAEKAHVAAEAQLEDIRVLPAALLREAFSGTPPSAGKVI